MAQAEAEATTILAFPRKLKRPLPRQRTRSEVFPANVVALPVRLPVIILPELTAETMILASIIWTLPEDAQRRLRALAAPLDADDDQNEAVKTFIRRALNGQSI